MKKQRNTSEGQGLGFSLSLRSVDVPWWVSTRGTARVEEDDDTGNLPPLWQYVPPKAGTRQRGRTRKHYDVAARAVMK